MTRRILPHQNFQDIVESQIAEARRNGAFDNLPFHGQPLPDSNDVYDGNWWIKNKMKTEKLDAAPQTIRIRRKVEQWRMQVLHIPNEFMVRKQANQLNVEIQNANKGNLGPLQPQPMLDVEELVKAWRRDR